MKRFTITIVALGLVSIQSFAAIICEDGIRSDFYSSIIVEPDGAISASVGMSDIILSKYNVIKNSVSLNDYDQSYTVRDRVKYETIVEGEYETRLLDSLTFLYGSKTRKGLLILAIDGGDTQIRSYSDCQER